MSELIAKAEISRGLERLPIQPTSRGPCVRLGVGTVRDKSGGHSLDADTLHVLGAPGIDVALTVLEGLKGVVTPVFLWQGWEEVSNERLVGVTGGVVRGQRRQPIATPTSSSRTKPDLARMRAAWVQCWLHHHALPGVPDLCRAPGHTHLEDWHHIRVGVEQDR